MTATEPEVTHSAEGSAKTAKHDQDRLTVSNVVIVEHPSKDAEEAQRDTAGERCREPGARDRLHAPRPLHVLHVNFFDVDLVLF